MFFNGGLSPNKKNAIKIPKGISACTKRVAEVPSIIFKPVRRWDTKKRLLASIKKAQKLIDYKPVGNFEDGFNENINWIKENWSIIEELADFPPGISSAVR